MARLELPIVPYRLYRYRSLTRNKESIAQEIDAIIKNYLWCSNYKAMNDPMEGFYRPSRRLKVNPKYEPTYDAILHNKTSLGLASFTDVHDNTLMWAHYAANYSGMCVRYRTDDLLSGLSDDVSLVRVAYTKGLPRLSSEDATNVDVAARKILSQKIADWAYESEWRILGPRGRVDIADIGKGIAVTRIYFGSATAPDHVERIRRELDGLGVKFFRMEVQGYKHDWQQM
jgi:hypothetical protein